MKNCELNESYYVSIPYLSGHPFLPGQGVLIRKPVVPVSIPYLPGPPFLPAPAARDQTLDTPVSIPYLSGHPFLHSDLSEEIRFDLNRVNPLSIGTPISTSQRKR